MQPVTTIPTPAEAWKIGQRPHVYRPDERGTQCVQYGCWGWVDDARHIHLPRGAAGRERGRLVLAGHHTSAVRRRPQGEPSVYARAGAR